MKRVFPITWSKLDIFERCPYQFYLLHGSKFLEGKAVIPFGSSEALEKGSKIHENMETAINNVKRGRIVNENLPHPKSVGRWWWMQMVKSLVAKYPQSWVESQLAIDTFFNRCEIDKWWKVKDKNQTTLFRGKVDAAFFNGKPFQTATKALLIDWKTGKVRKAPMFGQLHTQALLMFPALPQLEVIESQYIFLEHKKKQSYKITRAELESIEVNFIPRFEELQRSLDENDFPKNPGTCHWCPALKLHCDFA